MEALTAKAALVDPAALDESSAITTTIPRSEIEDALREKGPTDLFLDVARVRNGGHGDPERILVTWQPEDLERLLETTPADNVTLAFKPDELARMLEEPDVEAQGLREKAAVLSVAATTALGISAGVAGAQVAPVAGDAGGGGAAAAAIVTDTTSSGPGAVGATEASSLAQQEHAFRISEESTGGVGATGASSLAQQEHAFRISEESTGGGAAKLITDTTSSGPGAPAEAATGSGGTQFVTDATSSGPGSTVEAAGGGTQFVTDATSSGPSSTVEAASASGGTEFVTDTTSSGPGSTIEATGAGGDSFVASTGGAATLAGIALLIVGAGFLASRQRRGVQPA